MNSHEAKSIIDGIQKEIEASKNTHIWSDYINALKLIAQVVFTRSSGFILELLQNAEDAGLGLEYSGVFEIKINQHRAKVIHNGHPFNESDVKALCGIRSSKKPEKGTLGYLGIGFKSVFKVTDSPEIYSDGLQFKFDRNNPAWDNPSNTPWHVLPIWIEHPSEPVDPEKTTFIVPFRDETYYQSLLQEVAKLRTELYLFLRWIKRIEVVDEVSGRSWVLENAGESKDGIVTLRHDSQAQRFRFFRHTCQVPDWVKGDRLTQEYRANVAQREIAIAFAIDGSGNLAPIQAGVMYGGVYSFLPLGEAKSGAKFPIQADFLVQPGRDAVNYEANWNHWLIEEVANLCKEAIEYFKKHDKWKYQFLPAFAFTKTKGLESYDKLFGPKLIEPIEKFLQEEDCMPLINGGWAKLSQVVRLTENPAASEDLISMGILHKNEIASVLGGQDGLKLVHPEVQEPYQEPIKKVSRQELLDNKAFLEHKRKQPDAARWFRSLYLWLNKHPSRYKSGRSWKVKGYHDVEFILTADGKLSTGGNVLLPDLPPSDPILKNLSDTLQKSKPVLHPEILAGAKDEQEQKALRGFLLGYTGVQLLDSKTVCRDALLPKILTSAPKPTPEDLLKYTTYCQQILGEEISKDLEFWVLAKRGDIRAAKETLFPKEFHPERDWETHQKYVPGLNFVSPNYLAETTIEEQLKRWRQFFKAGGVKDDPDNGVELFAEHFSIEKLSDTYVSMKKVDKLNFGYDLEAETKEGEKVHIEVKGKREDKDVELTRNETDAADKYGDSFYICVVYSIPENPSIYMVNDPAELVKVIKITLPIVIPSHIWKSSKWKC